MNSGLQRTPLQLQCIQVLNLMMQSLNYLASFCSHTLRCTICTGNSFTTARRAEAHLRQRLS